MDLADAKSTKVPRLFSTLMKNTNKQSYLADFQFKANFKTLKNKTFAHCVNGVHFKRTVG